jgi:hypothetical protein
MIKEVGLDNSGIARDIAKQSFLEYKITTLRKNFLGDKWVIKENLFIYNKTMNFSSQKIKFIFSDGNEICDFSLRINGSQSLKRSFNVRIPGHKNGEFLGIEILEVDSMINV